MEPVVSAPVREGGKRERNRHAWLLGVLLCFHVIAPAVVSTSAGVARVVLLPLYAAVLGAAALAMSGGRRRLIVGVLAVPLGVAMAAVLVSEDPEALSLPVAGLPFLAYTSVVVFRDVLRPGVIDEARLLGSASVFILMAQVWAGVYAGLAWLDPGAFAVSSGEPVTPVVLTYFSLVTQTTLGYGDVTPASGMARAFATLQALAGLFYMGVVVARFAGGLGTGGGGDRDPG